MKFQVILKNWQAEGQEIVLSEEANQKNAEDSRRRWRKLLGGNRSWVIDRRPGLDTLYLLALTVRKVA